MSQPTLFDEREHFQDNGWKPPQTLPDLSQYKRIGFDTESNGNKVHESKPIGLSVATEDGKKWYLPWGHKAGGNLDYNLITRWIGRELRGKQLVGVNCKFDHHMMTNIGVDLEKQGCAFHDIAFKAALLNEHRYSGFSLESLAEEYLKDPEDRKVHPCHIKPEDFWKVPAFEIAQRAESDALLALKIDKITNELCAAEELGKVVDLEDRLIFPVAHMERNGAKLNMDKLQAWRKQADEDYQNIILSVWRKTGLKVSPDSAKDMTQLFNKLEIPLMYGEDNSLTFDAKHLKKVQHEIVQEIFKARKIKSIKSKYLDKYARAMGAGDILRYSLHQLRGDEYGTVSGRFSCANVNIQQVMKPEKQIDELGDFFIIRELFIPEKDRIWVSADAAQIEFRLFAHYANSDKLNDAYKKDPWIDFHNAVMEMIRVYQPDYTRKKAKNTNFGKLYGMGRDKMAQELGYNREIPEECAIVDALFNLYDREFPEAKRLLNMASSLAEKRGYVKTYMGRRSRFQDKKRLHKALNCVIQGTAADVMKLKIIEMYEAREALEFKMRFTVHDEIDGDVPSVEHSKKLGELLNTQSFPFRVPILWEVETGTDWKLAA